MSREFTAEKKNLIEAEFPSLKDVIYLNTCLVGIPPVRVQEAYRREIEELVASHGSEDDFDERRAAAREDLAWLIGAAPGEIALTNNTTAGMDVISLGYPWDPEKEVIVYEKEHFANLVDVLLRGHEGRYKLRTIPPKEHGVRAEDITGLITEKTQAVFVSSIQYSDGAMVDLKKIGEACRQAGALLIVDAIQSLGRIRIDVKECNIAFLASGCHKGLMVRNGLGFLYCRKDLIEKIRPFNGGHMSYTKAIWPYAHDFRGILPWHEDARRFENGNLNDPGVYALHAAISLIRELGSAEMEDHILWLQERFLEYCGEGACEKYVRGDLPGGLMIFPFDAANREKVKSIAEKYRIYGTLRPDNLRVCLNIYNTDEQMKNLAAAAGEIEAL
ncbi:MAG: aminotransferase class V-fold PLP-dependent enzyme [Lachnospiraceae bacterium]|nr:aminotransferase class V-fold PLP-dependent enzyme [Lachnospiraceae bacterium]